MMFDGPTYSTVIVNGVLETMGTLGYDADQIKSDLGLESETFGSDQDRISRSVLIDIWTSVDATSPDPDIGLHLAEHYPLGARSVISYLLISSRNLLEGYQRLIHYQRIIAEANPVTIQDMGDRVVIGFVPKAICRTQAEFFALGILRMISWVLNSATHPLQVSFRHSRPASIMEHERLLCCPIEFNATSNCLVMEKSAFEAPSLHANPHMCQVFEGVADNYIKDLQSHHLIENVRTEISRTLETGTVHIDGVAKALDMSERQLKEALALQNTSFSEVFESLRQQIATSLLANTQYSITEVAFLCGYRESSSFVRAFRRWLKVSPSQYRKKIVAQQRSR